MHFNAVACSLKGIDPNVQKEKSLLLLDASENAIESIRALLSEDLKYHLAYLERLDLRSNQITYIPEEIDKVIYYYLF